MPRAVEEPVQKYSVLSPRVMETAFERKKNKIKCQHKIFGYGDQVTIGLGEFDIFWDNKRRVDSLRGYIFQKLLLALFFSTGKKSCK